MNEIIFINGSKGGVGKSVVTLAALDYFQIAKQPVFAIETDTSNADFGKAAKIGSEKQPGMNLLLDNADGWIELTNTLEARSETVLVNTGARNIGPLQLHGGNLFEALPLLKRHLTTLWVINAERDSIILLKEFIDQFPPGPSHVVHVIKNAAAHGEQNWTQYDQSATAKRVHTAGGKSVVFPSLASRVMSQLKNDRLLIEDAAQVMPLGSRIELQRWRTQAHAVLKEVLP